MRLLAAVIGILGDVRSCVRTQDERAAPVYSFAASMCCSDTIILLLAFAGPTHTQSASGIERAAQPGARHRGRGPPRRPRRPTAGPRAWRVPVATAPVQFHFQLPLPRSSVHVIFLILYAYLTTVFGFVHRRACLVSSTAETPAGDESRPRDESRVARTRVTRPRRSGREQRGEGGLCKSDPGMSTRGRACR